MKFKQYKLILESDKKEDKDPHPMFKDMSHYRKQIESEDEIVKLIKEKCDVKNYLYRGFEDHGDHYIIDGSKGKRVSKNTSNYYTTIMDDIFKTNPSYKNYPLRSESIICSTSKNTASHYGNVYVILPFKGVDIGYLGDDDIWNNDIEIGEYEFRIQNWNIIYKELGISDDGGYNDIINGLYRMHNDAIMTLIEFIEEEYHNQHEDDDDYTVSLQDLEKLIDGDVFSDMFGVDIHSDSVLISFNKGDVDKIVKYAVVAKMFGCEELTRDKIEKVILDAYEPADLGFELIKTEDLHKHVREDVECWFGDKCVAVSIDKWEEIKNKV